MSTTAARRSGSASARRPRRATASKYARTRACRCRSSARRRRPPSPRWRTSTTISTCMPSSSRSTRAPVPVQVNGTVVGQAHQPHDQDGERDAKRGARSRGAAGAQPQPAAADRRRRIQAGHEQQFLVFDPATLRNEPVDHLGRQARNRATDLGSAGARRQPSGLPPDANVDSCVQAGHDVRRPAHLVVGDRYRRGREAKRAQLGFSSVRESPETRARLSDAVWPGPRSSRTPPSFPSGRPRSASTTRATCAACESG